MRRFSQHCSPCDPGALARLNCAMKKTLITTQILTSILFCVSGCVGIAFGVLSHFNFLPYGTDAIGIMVRGFVLLMGVNLALIGFFLASATLRTLTQSLTLNNRALLVKELCYQRLCEWKNLSCVRRSTLNECRKNHLGLGALFDEASIEFANGVNISIGPALKVRARLLAMVERKILKAQQPCMLATIDDGGSVDFNSVSLSVVGLHRGGRVMRWDDVCQVDVSSGESIKISTDSGLTFSLTVGKMRNPRLFLSIVEILWSRGPKVQNQQSPSESRGEDGP